MAAQGIRDPTYYFEDGSVIFLVEGYLFKIQCSLITSKSEVFRDMFKLPKQLGNATFDISPGAEGTCDQSPIVIPQVQARQFRHLMLFFYGAMTDPDYVSLVSSATDETQHNMVSFERYVDIASLANRFCMAGIEDWARRQLIQVLHSSQRLSGLWWKESILLDALWCSKLIPDRELEHNVRNLAESFLSFLPLYDVWRATCIARLYKDPELKTRDPALFGHIFCVVLSAGHQSPFWKTCLTREDRSNLFAAQAYLTPLPASLSLDWISDVTKLSLMVDGPRRSPCFPGCLTQFTGFFNSHFNCGTELARDSPLAGVTALSSLATRRQSLVEGLRPLNPECKCADQLISALDLKMNALFTELAEKYHGCPD